MELRNGLGGARHIRDSWAIEKYVEYYVGMMAFEREQLFAHNIGIYERRRRRSKKSYFKIVLKKSDDRYIFLMFWAPEGKTRPHRHVYEGRGSAAVIHVLNGTIVQELFSIGEEEAERFHYDEHPIGGVAIEEDPDCIHRIGNKSLSNWAVTIHEFTPGFAMQVYDFELNRTWIVGGKEDTLGDPPTDARQIWLARSVSYGNG